MKNRALVTAFHFPPQAASSGIQRTLSFSKYLPDYGWEPLILSASPLAYEQKNFSQMSAIPPGVLVHRTFALDTKRHLGIGGRYPEIFALPDRWVSWWLSAVPIGLQLIRRHKPRLIWSTFPIASAHLISLTLHRKTGLPWVADFRDPMLQASYPVTKLQRKCYQWIEHQAITHCDKAVFTTYSALDSYKARFHDSLHAKFTVIENGYDEEIFSALDTNSLPKTSLTRKRVTLLHSGVLYETGRDPSAFLAAIATLKRCAKIDKNSFSVIFRAPGDLRYFNSLFQKYGIEDIVQVGPPIPYREALHEMLAADGLLVFQGCQFNTQVPAKIYEYFRARKPIFSLVDPAGETARILASAGLLNMAPMSSSDAIIPALENFVELIRSGKASIASDEVVTASSRRHRAHHLAEIFDGMIAR